MKRNPALENTYEPGSTFKIVAFSAALEEKLVRPDDTIDCQMGSITVFGRVVHDSHPHGVLTITDALAKSSNVAAIKLGMRVGNARLYDYIRRYGFGEKKGVCMKPTHALDHAGGEQDHGEKPHDQAGASGDRHNQGAS